MIRYIPAKRIDRIKYDRCIEKSQASRIYAYSWYLDCTCDRWDLLIEGDYDFVMPLPMRVKYGIPYIYMPSWVQQLGLFSNDLIDENRIKSFLKAIPKKIRWIDYQFNADNKLPNLTSVLKRNYLLSLDQSFEEIKKHYNTNRKRISKNCFKEYVIEKKGSADIFLSHYKKLNKSYDVLDQSIDKLNCLCQISSGKVNVWNVLKDGVFIAGLIWLKDKNRITYLVPLADDQAKKLHIPTYIINELIKDYQTQELVLDFEGSMVSGVEKFYQSFGAKAEHYSYYKKRIF
ncbi:hypothetical protein QWY87_05650 [Lutimonas halocynthiae]|uniref:GNAT family N-acetyltransferase n=1 Tax=Lutimonas halocynthiae TaxID=1446477 RepID=UPI0025B4276B|nr:hypothetical protein [Lutimonas halocynthiae]MDN3642174.1 hypothetical protein [Lutimonas halocynthiae]